MRRPYLGIYQSAFLDHWVKPGRLCGVFQLRCTRGPRSSCIAVVWGFWHSCWQRSGNGWRFGHTKEFICQSISWNYNGKKIVAIKLCCLYKKNKNINIHAQKLCFPIPFKEKEWKQLIYGLASQWDGRRKSGLCLPGQISPCWGP